MLNASFPFGIWEHSNSLKEKKKKKKSLGPESLMSFPGWQHSTGVVITQLLWGEGPSRVTPTVGRGRGKHVSGFPSCLFLL